MDPVIGYWIAFFGVGVLLVVLAWAGGRRRRVRVKDVVARDQYTGCGNCGYDLTGLPGDVCPECGSEISLVGRIAPTFKRWQAVPVTARLIVWTMAVLFFGAGIVYLGYDFAYPRRETVSVSREWYYSEQKGPEDVTDAPFHVEASVRLDTDLHRVVGAGVMGQEPATRNLAARQGTWKNSHLLVSVTRVPRAVDGKRPPATSGTVDSWFSPNGSGIGFESFDSLAAVNVGTETEPATVEELLCLQLELAGCPPDQARELGGMLAPQIVRFLELGVSGRVVGEWVSGGTAILSSSRSDLRWATIVSGAFWFLVWLAGLPFILKKRMTRVHRETDDPLPSSQ